MEDGPGHEDADKAEINSNIVLSPTWAQVVRGGAGRRMSSHTMVLRRQTICPGESFEDQEPLQKTLDFCMSPSSTSKRMRKAKRSDQSPLVAGIAEGATPASSRGANILAYATEEIRKVSVPSELENQ